MSVETNLIQGENMHALILIRFCTLLFLTFIMVDVSAGQGYFPALIYLASGIILAVWSLHWGKS